MFFRGKPKGLRLECQCRVDNISQVSLLTAQVTDFKIWPLSTSCLPARICQTRELAMHAVTLLRHISITFAFLWLVLTISQNCLAATITDKARDDQWIEMPAGGKSSYMGINGGTMPVSLLVSDDGVSLLSFAGKTANDFLEVLREAYLPFPSFANSARNKYAALFSRQGKPDLFAGNATTSMPVLSLEEQLGRDPELLNKLQPFGLSEEPLLIEGQVSPPTLTTPKKIRLFFMRDNFFSGGKAQR